jgi:threonine dehydrogenase-like Zn-dependent dehydrogenase
MSPTDSEQGGMRALRLTAPGRAEIVRADRPIAAPGEVTVRVERVGVCGTEVELFDGSMSYLHNGTTHYPLRPGHEWCGTVAELGRDVDPRWAGRRVTSNPMIGCGRCRRCTLGRQHLCADRGELGVRDGRPGALAEYVAVPVPSLHELPAALDPSLGAMVEPAGNALRAAEAAREAGDRALVMGPGTIGLLVAQFLRSFGSEVHVLGPDADSLTFARSLGFKHAWTTDTLPDLPFAAVIDASNAAHLPALAADLVEPGGRVVCIGLAGKPSNVDTRALALKDVTLIGILSASPAFAEAITHLAEGRIDPRPLISATVGLDAAAFVLAGGRPAVAGPGPKIHIDPHR